MNQTSWIGWSSDLRAQRGAEGRHRLLLGLFSRPVGRPLLGKRLVRGAHLFHQAGVDLHLAVVWLEVHDGADIVAESVAPDANISAVARRNGVNRGLLAAPS